MKVHVKFTTRVNLVYQMLNFTAGGSFNFCVVFRLRLVISKTGVEISGNSFFFRNQTSMLIVSISMTTQKGNQGHENG
ncbi:MAG: hypothetical protein U0V04_11150 [Spirosomataceae bacterium]